MMQHEKMLSISERARITILLSENKTTLEISKIIKRDHRTFKRFVSEVKIQWKEHKGGHSCPFNIRDKKNIKKSLI